MTIKLASDDDYNRSHIYLDTKAAQRAQRSADYLAHYEANRARFESFEREDDGLLALAALSWGEPVEHKPRWSCW